MFAFKGEGVALVALEIVVAIILTLLLFTVLEIFFSVGSFLTLGVSWTLRASSVRFFHLTV
jgi:hypothetical protein